MRESIQHKLDVVRPPRVQITYDVELAGAVISRELPYVLGVMADLSGASQVQKASLKERKFIDVASDNFIDIMNSIKPRVQISVTNKLNGGKGPLGVDLTFLTMDDFGPLSVVQQTSPLKALFDSRTRLNDLLGKLDGNEDLNRALDGVLSGETKKADVDTLVKEGNLVRDPSQADNAKLIIGEFLTLIDKKEAQADNAIAVVSQKISQLDQNISAQLNEILHHPDFLKLEVWP